MEIKRSHRLIILGIALLVVTSLFIKTSTMQMHRFIGVLGLFGSLATIGTGLALRSIDSEKVIKK